MKRTKLKDRVLPKYTKGEEIFNMVSHIVGGAIGVIALVLCIIFAAVHKNIYGVIASTIFGITIILLYTMSSIYHGLNEKLKAKKVFQVIDHCSIFLLIAGSYTPFALCTLREYDVALGWTIFGIVWGLAILGIVLNAIDLKKYKVFSMVCYLLMGWCIIIKASVLPQLLGTAGFALLLAGGIVYTIGAILYGAGKKHKWMHSIFHLACVIGSLLHFLCVVMFVV
ncbi:MAG: hemolysin III family protein [Clostridia bacterium]|nr:hemolysin III family protein [Clostridia bacterium]